MTAPSAPGADLDAQFDAACRLHRDGRLQEAFDGYQRIVGAAPDHLGALCQMGLLLVQAGQPEDAVQVLTRAGRLAPTEARPHALMGAALRAGGWPGEAEASLRRALLLDPQLAEAHCTLGELQLDAGRHAAAVDAFRAALEARPDFAEAEAGLGEALQGTGALGDARAALERATAIDPNLARAHNNLGSLHAAAGDYAAARACFERARVLLPEDPRVLANLAGACFNLGQVDDAVELCREALSHAPDDLALNRQLASLLWTREDWDGAAACLEQVLAREPDAVQDLHLLGRSFVERREPAAAIAPLRRAHAGAPDDVGVLCSLAQALQLTLAYDDAKALFERALALDPTEITAFVGLMQIERDSGRLDAALTLGARALALDPDNAPARSQHCHTLLSLGRLGEAWDLYDSRFDKDSGLKHGYRRGVVWDTQDAGGRPMWRGEPLDGKRIALFAEQGPGDVVMFLSCLPDLLARGAAADLIVQKRMVALAQRSFPSVRVEGHNQLQRGLDAPRTADYNMPLGSLPRYLRRSDADFPRRRQYLEPNPDRVQLWRERFRALLPDGQGVTVGISWRGGTGPYFGAMRRSALDDWLPLLRCPDSAFVSLQYGTPEERKAWLDEFHARSGIRVADWDDSDPKDDLDGLAAQVAALDLVVSMANTTVHFAGALGRPCWTVVPRMPSWRWVRGRTDCPWYPTMRLFWQRQEEDGFGPVMERVAACYLHNLPARAFYPDVLRDEAADERDQD